MGASCSKGASPSPVSSSTYGSGQEEAQSAAYTQHRLPPPSEPILEPNHPDFHPSANSKNRYAIEDIYEMGERLGAGTFGTVYLSTHKTAAPDAPWSKVALKQARLTDYDTHHGQRPVWSLTQLEAQSNEIRSLLKLQSCRAVVHLHEYFLAGQEYFLVTELLESELGDWKQTLRFFTEEMARNISRTLLNALAYMHSKNVVHRDIKMNNILFAKNGDCSSLKIVDFGLSKILGRDERTKQFCGSNGYIPPEIYSGKSYRFEVDLFAFGVVLFRLLSDQRPFSGNSTNLRRKTMELRYEVQGDDWKDVSVAAKNMIRRLLINSDERLTASEALAHPWMTDASASVLRSDGPLSRAQHGRVGRSRSGNAVLRQPAQPGTSMTRGVSKRYWVDGSLRDAMAMLVFTGTFHADVVEEQPGENGEEGMICYQENDPDDALTLPHYIARLGRYTEKKCRDLFNNIVERVQILHDSSVAHRNLHPDNILVQPNGTVTLKGFHFAQLIRPDRPLTGHFGYLYSWYAFKAPEVDQQFAHDRSVDVWSLGAVLYMMLTGLPPFRGTEMDLVDVKHAGIFDFDPVIPSGGAQRLVRNLLNIMPDERHTIVDILHDPWIDADVAYLERFELTFAQEQTTYW